MQQHTLAMVVLAGVAIGCTPDGGGKPPPPAAQDLGQPNIEPPPPPADLATGPDMAPIVCNDVDANGAPVVTAKYVAATAPAATGGAIADGTYALTAIGYYTGPGGMTGDAPQAFATVYRFKGNKLDVLMTTSPVGPFSASATFSTNGPQLVTTTTCPTAKTTTEEFSSDGNTFKLQQSQGNYATVFTFAKR